jgi:hypothetical protein
MSDKPERIRGGRRLTLLPEVLPVPTASGTVGSVRQRTLLHLRRLAATAATSAALACSREPAPPQVPNVAPPQAPNVAPPQAPNVAPPQAPNVAPAPRNYPPFPEVPVTPAPRDMRGYTVVDMLPPPAMCSGLAASVQASAVWRLKGSDWIVEITLPKPTLPGASWTADTPTSPNGVVVSTEWTVDEGGIIQWRPEIGNGAFGVFGQIAVRAACSAAREQAVRVSLDLGDIEKRREGALVGIQLFDTIR